MSEFEWTAAGRLAANCRNDQRQAAPKHDKMQVSGMDDRDDNMLGYYVGTLIAVGCTIIAVVTLAEKLLSQ
jgi:hypothetical protein